MLISVDMPFHIGGRYGWGGIQEFVNDADRPAFLERELMGLGMDGYQYVRVHDHAMDRCLLTQPHCWLKAAYISYFHQALCCSDVYLQM